MHAIESHAWLMSACWCAVGVVCFVVLSITANPTLAEGQTASTATPAAVDGPCADLWRREAEMPGSLARLVDAQFRAGKTQPPMPANMRPAWGVLMRSLQDVGSGFGDVATGTPLLCYAAHPASRYGPFHSAPLANVRSDPNERAAVRLATALIAHGAQVDAVDDRGRTALHSACARGNEAMIRLLFDANANVAARDNTGLQPLHLLVRHVSEEREIRFVERGLATMQLLVDRGADVSAKALDGASPLFCARELTARWLLDHGAHATDGLIDGPDNECTELPGAKKVAGMTPLMAAARTSFAEVKHIALLLKLGSDLHARDARGWTVVHHAAFANNEHVAGLALRTGAEADAFDHDGFTPLFFAPFGVLLAHGARANASTPWGLTPLHCHSSRALLEHGADPNAALNQLVTQRMEQALCPGERGARVAAVAGLTPMMTAAESCRAVDSVRASEFQAHGGNSASRDAQGCDVACYAERGLKAAERRNDELALQQDSDRQGIDRCTLFLSSLPRTATKYPPPPSFDHRQYKSEWYGVWDQCTSLFALYLLLVAAFYLTLIARRTHIALTPLAGLLAIGLFWFAMWPPGSAPSTLPIRVVDQDGMPVEEVAVVAGTRSQRINWPNFSWASLRRVAGRHPTDINGELAISFDGSMWLERGLSESWFVDSARTLRSHRFADNRGFTPAQAAEYTFEQPLVLRALFQPTRARWLSHARRATTFADGETRLVAADNSVHQGCGYDSVGRTDCWEPTDGGFEITVRKDDQLSPRTARVCWAGAQATGGLQLGYEWPYRAPTSGYERCVDIRVPKPGNVSLAFLRTSDKRYGCLIVRNAQSTQRQWTTLDLEIVVSANDSEVLGFDGDVTDARARDAFFLKFEPRESRMSR